MPGMQHGGHGGQGAKPSPAQEGAAHQGHEKPAAGHEEEEMPGMDHSGHEKMEMPGMDHSKMQH